MYARASDLPQLLDAVKTAGFAGTNVTFPYKQEVLTLLDEIDREAGRSAPSIPSPLRRTAAPPATTPTGAAFAAASRRGLAAPRPNGATVVLVGAGGAGRAVAFALMDLGAATVVLYDRDSRARQGIDAGPG